MTPHPALRQPRELENYVGGSWRPATSGGALDDTDPASGEVVARVPLSAADDVDAAVAAAREAQVEWARTPPSARAAAIGRLGDAIGEDRAELARLITSDMGKTLAEADAEVARGLESVEVARSAPELLKGEMLPLAGRDVDVSLVRQPVGVVAAITPFNFPVMIPLWFVPLALAAGNGVVLKPSERDPLATARLIELFDGVGGFPDGILSLVHGGAEAVEAILRNPHIGAVSFVGRARTARLIARRAAEEGKRVQALGGAKNALVLMPDADPDTTVSGVLSSAFGAGGQRCLAGSVAILVGTAAEQDRWLDLLVDEARRLRTGPGSDPGTDICPLIDDDARRRIDEALDAASASGATLLLDGRSGARRRELGATIVETQDPASPLVRDELFGPVLAVLRARELGDAVSFVNAGRYGNAAMIFTASGHAARRFQHDVEAGMVGVNVGVAAPVAWFPFSGWKDSFVGDLHANGADAIRFFTRTQVTTARWVASR